MLATRVCWLDWMMCSKVAEKQRRELRDDIKSERYSADDYDDGSRCNYLLSAIHSQDKLHFLPLLSSPACYDSVHRQATHEKNIVNFLRKVRTGSSTIQLAFLACRDYQRWLAKAWMHFSFIRHSKIYITIYVRNDERKILFISWPMWFSFAHFLCNKNGFSAFQPPFPFSQRRRSFIYLLFGFFSAQSRAQVSRGRSEGKSAHDAVFLRCTQWMNDDDRSSSAHVTPDLNVSSHSFLITYI